MNRKNVGAAITLIAVGLLLGFLILNFLVNEIVVEILFGVVIGCALTVLSFYALRKIIDFNNLSQGKNGKFHLFAGKKLSQLLGAPEGDLSEEELRQQGENIAYVIRGFLSGLMLFSVFAMCISVAMYYSSLMQVKKLSEQNKLVTTQNNLICAQNNLAETSNQVSLYAIESQRLDISQKSLVENNTVFSKSLKFLKKCKSHIAGGFYASDVFYECIEENVMWMEKPLYTYDLNKSNAYLILDNLGPDVKDLRNYFEKFSEIQKLENYKKFNSIVEPFLGYTAALVKLNEKTIDQIEEVVEKRNTLVIGLRSKENNCSQ